MKLLDRFTPATRYRRRTWLRLTIVIAACLLVAVGIGVYRQQRWKRFAVVEPGRLYRSGALTPAQLTAAIRRIGLKTVVCLAADLAELDRQVCDDQSVCCVVLAMPDDGLGRPEDFAKFLELACDPAACPLLVHCQAGVARTGAAVALFRMLEQGWTYDEAVAELRSFERHGRCEPALQQHLKQTHARLRSGRLAAHDPATPRR